MPVSSNTLFHFTNSIENILNILRNDFIPRYHKEIISLGDDVLEFACPMVCFCDIPLSQIKNHISVYGNYGIGLSKEWGIKNKLNPVLYLEKNSNLSDYIFELMKLVEVELPISAEYHSRLQNMNEVLMHIKPYNGEIQQAGEENDNYIFYNEKEWRYVPKGFEMLSSDEFQKEAIIVGLNNKLSKRRLVYSPSDIKYIILQDSDEIDEFIKQLQIIKKTHSTEIVNRVISRVITIRQINEDF